MTEENYIISGMTCAACSASVERVTRKLQGVQRSDVNLTTSKMNIVYDDTKLKPDDIITAVEKAGFDIELEVKEQQEKVKPKTKDILKTKRNNLIYAIIFTVILLYVSMGQMFSFKLPIPRIIDMNSYPTNFALIQLLLTIPILYFGRNFFTNGFKTLFHKNPNMDTLVAIGSGASFLYSVYLTFLLPIDSMHVHHLYYESAAVVITFIMIGKYLESRNKEKTKDSIKKLMELSPEKALIIKDGTPIEIETALLKTDDIVLVKPGAKVPTDGIVVDGSSGVNESMITGENMPVQKEINSEVIGGSINCDGVLQVKVTQVGQNTVLSKIVKFVEDAQGKKAPISKIADKVAGIFVPTVMAIAIISAIVWALVGKDISFVLRIFTSILVIACPCALGLATPTAIMVGTGLGAKNGILIRSGEALELTHNVNTVVFDKTGTVTKGKPEVKEIISEIPQKELLTTLYAIENNSAHPVATAICEKATELLNKDQLTTKVSNFENISGKGIIAEISGQKYLVGNTKLMVENNIDISKYNNDFDKLSSIGQTVMFIAKGTTPIGLISIADTIRESSINAIQNLKSNNIEVVLLTGDNKQSANYIGEKLGVSKVISEVLPEQKASIIENIQGENKTVMMVGDGINDAPALTVADVGVAMGSGSDIAIESGDIVLMKTDLNDIPKAIKLSKMTIKNVKENLFWAFCYNTIGIPIAAGVLYFINGMLLSPMFAGLAMSLSSVCVVSNALRLRGKKL